MRAVRCTLLGACVLDADWCAFNPMSCPICGHSGRATTISSRSTLSTSADPSRPTRTRSASSAAACGRSRGWARSASRWASQNRMSWRPCQPARWRKSNIYTNAHFCLTRTGCFAATVCSGHRCICVANPPPQLLCRAIFLPPLSCVIWAMLLIEQSREQWTAYKATLCLSRWVPSSRRRRDYAPPAPCATLFRGAKHLPTPFAEKYCILAHLAPRSLAC